MKFKLDGWTRVLLNAVATGAIASISIMLAMPGQAFEGPALIAACLSGVLAAAREIKDYCDDEEKKPKQKKSQWHNVLLF